MCLCGAELAGWASLSSRQPALAIAAEQVPFRRLRHTALVLHIRQRVYGDRNMIDLVQLALTMGFHLIREPKGTEATVLLGFPGASQLDMSDNFAVIAYANVRSPPKARYTY